MDTQARLDDGRVYIDVNGEVCEGCGGVYLDARGCRYLYPDGQTWVLRCKPCLYAIAHLVDPMPIADAQADAETLRLAQRDILGWCIEGFELDLKRSYPNVIVKRSIEGARRAFRACPGLRG